MLKDNSWFRVFSRGVYSCRWKHRSEEDLRRTRKKKNACCWFSAVATVTLLSLSWMYICLVTFNDREDVNWQGFAELKRWVNWFMVLVITSAVLTCYCVLLLLFAMIQVALREPLNLHWLHKVLLFFGCLFISFGVAGISLKWRKEWATVLLSLQATAPFLQLGAVGALTLLSSFVFQVFHSAKDYSSKRMIAAAFILTSTAIFLCPLFIHSPCLIEQVPEKPKLIGHRGAPMLAPENTMMSFNKSISCSVWAFETDVQLSKDRIPFLMHDHNTSGFLRTTNIKEKFPDLVSQPSGNLTWQQLQSLNAGEWFLQTDPFGTVSKLSEQDRELARSQTIPSFLQLLKLAKEHNISVIFDLYSPDQENDTVETVDTISLSGIDPKKILWLPPAARDYVNVTEPGFIHIYNNETQMFKRGGNHLNMKYSQLSTSEIRDLRSKNITINVWVVNERWLFSLLWCAGVSSVTTNSCQDLHVMERPDWWMALKRYRIIWITADVVSVLIMAVIFMCHRTRPRICCRKGEEKQRNNATSWDEKELAPFIPTV
ncbi:glycerophosphoinositol inositolphosphodiesterase GDPD2 [Synchiropus picturatus]